MERNHEHGGQSRHGTTEANRAYQEPAFGAGSANTPDFDTAGHSGAGRPEGRQAQSGGQEQEGGRMERAREAVSEHMEGTRHRLEDRIDEGMKTSADRMEGIAHRLEDMTEAHTDGTGARARVGSMAHQVADRMESTAETLREQDAHSLIENLEDRVRERPLEMLALGVGAGWLMGKILK